MGLTKLRAEQISDIDYKQAVRVITVSNITLSGGAPSQVDGVNLVLNDRILVAGQNTGSQNGLYYVTTLGTGSNGTWQRTSDSNQTGEIEAGMIVMVTEGTVYKDTQWKLTTNNPIVIGTTALTFEQNSAFAFGNVFANGTAVLATTVGDSITLTPGNNIQITGNNTSKTVTIGVTGISLNSISNGTSNVNVVSSGGNVTVGVGGTANVAEFSTTGLRVTGSSSATGNVIGGNISTAGLVTATGNVTGGNLSTAGAVSATANITGGNILTAGLISATSTITSAANVIGGNISTAGLVTATGNVTGGNINTAGLVSATGNLQAGNLRTAGLISATGNLDAGNLRTIGLVSATGNIDGGNLRTAGLVTATGNVTGNNFIGNVLATTVSASGNVTGGNLLTAGLISATSTITSASNITGGNLLTGGLISATSTITSAANVIGGNISTAGLVTATGNIDGGNLRTAGLISATGNLDAGNLRTIGLISATGNIDGGNLRTVGIVSATGNITGNYFLGNGAFLTGLTAGASNAIANGATRIDIPVSSGNIAMSVAGQSNTVVINLGSFTMYGAFAGPKTLEANVSVANAVNGVIFGPVTVGNAYNISVPDASTVYVYSGS